jgi:hypothetical protein
MLVTFDLSDAGKPIDRMILKHVGETLTARKSHRRLLCRVGKSTQVVDAEIAMLRRVVLQIEALQSIKQATCDAAKAV